MKIKSLMDFLNNSNEPEEGGADYRRSTADENVVYIENPSVETVSEQKRSKELLYGGTQWADQSLGEILVALGKLNGADIERIIDYQRERGMYFGEAAVQLELVTQDDILQALSDQFGYTYGQGDETPSEEKGDG